MWDPINGPKIFDALNSRQEPMTTGDLIRNEIFGKVANEHPDAIEAIDQRSWQPFYKKFRTEPEINLFDSYFFPYGLIQDPNLRKSEVYARLREQWKDTKDPEVIVKQLAEYQEAFLDVACGSNLKGHSRDLHRAFSQLHEAGAPSSTYPFTMRLSNALKNQHVTEEEGVAILGIIESFLVRRAICGHEPTGLHAVFKRLWVDCEGQPTAEKVTKGIRAHRTVVWPTDADVINAVVGRPLYGSSITFHVLAELNRHIGGDQPGTPPWIEHVLPDSPSSEWFAVFTTDEHQSMKDLLANLLPLSQEMNQTLGNGPYVQKRQIYRDDSGFKSARKFAEDYSAWTPQHLRDRSEALASWVVEQLARSLCDPRWCLGHYPLPHSPHH